MLKVHSSKGYRLQVGNVVLKLFVCNTKQLVLSCCPNTIWLVSFINFLYDERFYLGVSVWPFVPK